jgi:hypothetical protein
MIEITAEYAKAHNLKKLGIIQDTDMSKIIIKLERLRENKSIKYYCMDFIVFDPVRQIGNMEVSLWADS